MKSQITKDIEIEELVRKHPSSVRFLAERGIRCIACGEPVWGTLEEAAMEKQVGPDELERIVRDLHRFLEQNET
jgi:hypothetical protein